MNIQSIFRIICPFFRRRRMAVFQRWLAPGDRTRILDVGGVPEAWDELAVKPRLTILNIYAFADAPARRREHCEFVVGDGTALPYGDRTFDIVFSNSVIEHVGTFDRQKQFAREAARVGQNLWVQTPARCFFVEPHLLTPFIHWLPRGWRKKLLRYGTVWGWLTKPTAQDVENFLNEVRLLNYAEMQALFPDCHIHRERVLGLTKSYVAIRRGDSGGGQPRTRP